MAQPWRASAKLRASIEPSSAWKLEAHWRLITSSADSVLQQVELSLQGRPSGGASDGVGGADDQGSQVINAEVCAQLPRILGAVYDQTREMFILF